MNQKRWFKCVEGPDHEWAAMLSNRVSSGTGCPCCAGQQPSVTNSFASLKPAATALWHPTLNGDLTPHGLTHGSGKRCWFRIAGADVHRSPHSFTPKKWGLAL